MNQILAARRTMNLIDERLASWTLDWDAIRSLPISMQRDHLNDMVNQMEANENPQGGEFSEGKLGRWLGWLQASACAMGVITLDDAKQINMEAK